MPFLQSNEVGPISFGNSSDDTYTPNSEIDMFGGFVQWARIDQWIVTSSSTAAITVEFGIKQGGSLLPLGAVALPVAGIDGSYVAVDLLKQIGQQGFTQLLVAPTGDLYYKLSAAPSSGKFCTLTFFGGYVWGS